MTGVGEGGNNTLRKFGGRVKGLRVVVHPLGGSGGMPHRKLRNFRPSEIASGAFYQTICGFQMT